MNASPRHDSSEDPQDLRLRQMINRLPEASPSHGFDARLVDALMRETPAPGYFANAPSDTRTPSTGLAGWLLGLRRPSWQLLATASLVLVIATSMVIQQWASDSDLTRVDLITLMSLDLL